MAEPNVRSLELNGSPMKSRLLLASFVVLAFLLSLSGQATAQATVSYALLNGTVSDEGGQVLAKAAVTLRSLDTNQTFSATANDAGFYAIPNLPPGRYELSISAPGFGKYTRTGLELNVGQTATANVTMKVASVTEQ